MKYNARAIEQKWTAHWEHSDIYKVSHESDRPKYYVLDMFPYPSGSGLHVGHPLGYIASDIVSRHKRMQGYNVLHPMGFDAFGLPAEQYAILHGIHPSTSTDENIERFKAQLKNLGLCYDWSRQVKTSDPAYYRWTQWIFLRLFDHYYDLQAEAARPIADLERSLASGGTAAVQAHHTYEGQFTADDWAGFTTAERDSVLMCYRLAYRRVSMVNWCEELGTVLANDEVKDGVSERGGHPVVQRPMLQWSLRITAYAERLLSDLDALDWSSALKTTQTNWIGKSTGAFVQFKIKGHEYTIQVYTTRPDTIYGVTFMVLAPEHPLVEQITSDDMRDEVLAYQDRLLSISDRQRQSSDKEVSGQHTGAYAIHPLTGEEVPIYIASYVLMDYGTGAIMAVPDDDDRDRAFATHYHLPIKQIVARDTDGQATTMINSPLIDGLDIPTAKSRMIDHLTDKGLGEGTVQYKLRDANFSRQRYWGEPFPIAYDGQGVAHAIDDLPVSLPELTEFKPASGGQSPLARLHDWVEMTDGRQRETDTMPGYAGSSWYFLRYMDPQSEDGIASSEALHYWQDVDLYIGGTEHAVGHLLYARFWHKFLYDIGIVPTQEPFKKLINQGMIQGRSSFVYRANEHMAEEVFKQRFKEYGLHPQTDYAVAGMMVDFAFPKDKIALELSNCAKLHRLHDELQSRFAEEGWTLIPIATEEVPSLYHDFDEVIKRINRVKEGHAPTCCPQEMTAPGLYISADMIKDSTMVTTLHVPIEYVKDDKLDIEAYMGYTADLADSVFITNHDGDYICGSAVEKMSKSKYNVVNPDDVIDRYGADVFRMYEMFLGPIEHAKPWDTKGIDGVAKFLSRFWGLFWQDDDWIVSDEQPTKEELQLLHRTIKKISEDLDRYAFNTCVSQFMILTNELRKLNCHKRAILEPLVRLLAPFAPHVTEELWERLGQTGAVLNATFPVWEEQYVISDEITYPVSINGKKRTELTVPADSDKAAIEAAALALDAVQKWVDGQPIKRVIVVPGRMVNVVV